MKPNNSSFEHALREMNDEQLLFLCKDKNSLEPLRQFIAKKNGRLYGQKQFKLMPTAYDHHYIVAATPDLGTSELGLFAAKNFNAGDIVGEYKGRNVFGRLPIETLQALVNESKESGDYYFELDFPDNTGVIIDSQNQGSLLRLVNHSSANNLEAEIRNGKLYYIAKTAIRFGTELSVSYGGQNYFNGDHKYIERKPSLLSHTLAKIAQLNHLDIDDRYFKNLASVQYFHELLNWHAHPLTNFTDEWDERDDSKTTLYLDQHEAPIIYDLSKKEDVDRLEIPKKFKRTSNHKFFVAPTDYGRFSLFAGDHINRGEPVCEIKGKNISPAELKTLKQKADFDEYYLFDFDKKNYLYCKNKGSEANFIQGTFSNEFANVKMSYYPKPKYIAIRDIKPGEEITVLFHGVYDMAQEPVTLQATIEDFNQTQIKWDGYLTWHEHDAQYALNFYPHIMTPGRNLTFSDAEQTPATKYPWTPPPIPEHITTPGRDENVYCPRDEVRDDVGFAKRKNNWSFDYLSSNRPTQTENTELEVAKKIRCAL